MSVDGEACHGRRCHHCGRAVHETVHTRSAYRVDFYALHTGDTEPVTLVDPDDGSSTTVLRLTRPFEFFTCAQCYQRPTVRAERDRLFRQEGTPGMDV